MTTISLLVFAGALASCSGTDEPDEADGGAPPAEGAVLIEDANNYLSTSLLTPPTIDTAVGEDLEICWDDLLVDMQCHDMSPSEDVDKVALLRFRGLTKQRATELLTAGELDMSDIDGYIQFETAGGQTCANLSDLSNLGTPVDFRNEYVDDESKAYMLLWATGTQPGTGARAMVFLNPTSSSLNTDVVAEPACDPTTGEGILDFTAELAEPLVMPPGSLVVDWRNVTLDGLGNPIFANNIDQVMVGFYEDMTVTDLESRIFDIELIATELWEAEFKGGRAVNLGNLRHRETNDYFEGFEGHPEGTWLLALRCSFCQNPAPLILTVLEPGE